MSEGHDREGEGVAAEIRWIEQAREQDDGEEADHPLHTAQDVRTRVRLDIEYVERQSLWLDLWIMAVTVPVLLGDRSAVR